MVGFLPVLTDRFLLRGLLPGDRDMFFAYRSRPEVMLYQGFQPTGIHDADAFIAGLAPAPGIPGTWFQLAVCRREDELVIGDIGLHFHKNNPEAGIGYTLHPDYWGQGVASETVSAVLDYLFGRMDIRRVTASVDLLNLRSVRLLERLGMRRETCHDLGCLTEEETAECCRYVLLREEWKVRVLPG